MSALGTRYQDFTLPDAGTWDFGGYPYGLEPLTLPLGHPVPEASAFPLWRDQAPAVDGLEAPADAVVDPDDPFAVDRLFWFRWITGHQATFILWQLLASATSADAGDDEQARWYVRGYSQMLLYTSSCPRTIYDRLIRPSLSLQHRHFSGSWARDFHPVRGLLRLRPGAGDSALHEECLLNQRVHEGVATKLVPSGASLLQKVTEHQGQRLLRRDQLLSLYDCVFHTVRAPLSYEQVVAQLVRRLHAINLDLAANGLYPRYAPSEHEESAELRDPVIAGFKQTLSADLSKICAIAISGTTDRG
ncbi:hypothetical protein NLX83_21810 [Allokutzneria sp. A3M-2-11 16]|uniref:hypothetical protein n=1 Tax=Allokutzneria sp. A3M-2-11 16 TaxID=2962043 RepID=UPI0020B72BE2|nr:hypothetical protein [Allokutzneria sp. A3M-2-11 16]MCP3801907.1 hypothetical protein [Allokutzneria sp. A3M-2-11 16]